MTLVYASMKTDVDLPTRGAGAGIWVKVWVRGDISETIYKDCCEIIIYLISRSMMSVFATKDIRKLCSEIKK